MHSFRFFFTVLFLTVTLGCSKSENPIAEPEPNISVTARGFSLAIDEFPADGTVLGTVTGSTNSGTVAFTIKSQSPRGALAINASSGEITVANSSLFSYENAPTISAEIEVRNGAVSELANVTISLNEPQSVVTINAEDLEVALAENPEPDQVLGAINASTNLGELSFSIVSQTPEGAMNINPVSGELTVAETSYFDFEVNSTLTALVLVKNGEIEVQVSVTLMLTDVFEPSVSFNQVTPSGTIFSPRTGMGTAVFNNKLYIAGGWDGRPARDVWSTSDGQQWTQVGSFGTSNTMSLGLEMVEFQSKLWIITPGAAPNIPNEIWSSPDGTVWTQETVQGDFFTGREGFELVVFQDKLWVIGGSNKNDIWSSADGIHWTENQVVGSHFSPRWQHQVQVFNNQLILIGGSDSSAVKLNDIWTSPDGEHWSEVTPSQSGFEPRAFHQIVEFQGRIWVIAGFGTDYLGDIWSSADGQNWKEEGFIGDGFSPRNYHTCIVFNNGLWVLGGRDAVGRLNDLWVMWE